MSGIRSLSALQAMLIVNASVIVGVLALTFIFNHDVATSLRIAAVVATGVVGGFSSWYFLRKGDAAPVAGPSGAVLENLRRESADNFGVLQKDIRSLGTALIHRLENNPDGQTSDSDAAISGAMTDLAISLAEARETLAAIASELAEVKSVAFEMQAQLDQQADALRAFEHTVERIQPEDTHDSGEGAAPGSLGKALAFGASGSAVARLIGNGYHSPEAGPESSGSVAATDVESDYGAPDATGPAADFDSGDLVAEHAADFDEAPPEVAGADPAAVAEEESEAEETDDWLSMGLEEEDGEGPVAAKQPDLLDIGDEQDSRRKPKRPGKHDTALIAHVMIGIGNKPYLRGQGPGLSPDKGVPMEYVDVGRWQWIAPETGTPLNITLWKNDEVPADGDAVGVPAGMTLEIHPHFAG